jgi:hypothetical protein
MSEYTLRVKRTDNVIGAIEFDSAKFAGITRKEAATLLLPAVQAQFPTVTALTFPGGQDGRDVKNKGGEVLVEVLPNGADAPADTGKPTPVRTSRVVADTPEVARDKRAIAWLMDGRMSSHTLEQAYEAVDAALASEQHERLVADCKAVMQDILAYNARISALEGLLEQAQDKLAGFPQAVRDAATPE